MINFDHSIQDPFSSARTIDIINKGSILPHPSRGLESGGFVIKQIEYFCKCRPSVLDFGESVSLARAKPLVSTAMLDPIPVLRDRRVDSPPPRRLSIFLYPLAGTPSLANFESIRSSVGRFTVPDIKKLPVSSKTRYDRPFRACLW